MLDIEDVEVPRMFEHILSMVGLQVNRIAELCAMLSRNLERRSFQTLNPVDE